jgi:hypothetical protein
MANSLYGKGRQSFLAQLPPIAWVTDTIKLLLVQITGAGTPYTVAINADQFRADIPSGAEVAVSPAFTSNTAVLGTANSNNVTITAVSGNTIGAIVIFKDTGVRGTSPLIAYIDTATGLPLTPNGGDITVVWDTGPNKIFTL